MKYYSLGSLRNFYISCSLLPALDLHLRWCQQATAAIKYLHSKYIVHGDISVCNILLSSSMNLKVCDLGFSGIEGQCTTGYAETRYCRFQTLTENKAVVMNDLFAIGCLLYEILTENRPYVDLDSDEVNARYKLHQFLSTDDVELHGYAIVIRKCWNDCYMSIFQLEEDLPLHIFMCRTIL